MDSLLILVGLASVGAILVDVFGSTFLPSRFRFIGFYVGVWVWTAFERAANGLRRPVIRIYAGPAIVFLVFMIWLVGIWAAWTISFSTHPDAVVDLRTGAPAGFWDRAYYVGGLLSTLGVGDFHSATSAWRMLSMVAGFTGLIVITLAISNFVTVVFALAETRALARELSSLGESGAEILRNGWDGKSFAPLYGRLQALVSPIFLQAERSQTSSVASHFAHIDRNRAISPSIAALDDALVLLRHAVAEELRPHPLLVAQLTEGIRHSVPVDVPAADSFPWPVVGALDILSEADIPLASDAHLSRAGEGDHDRRRHLAGWLARNGWAWEDRPCQAVTLAAFLQRGSMA